MQGHVHVDSPGTHPTSHTWSKVRSETIGVVDRGDRVRGSNGWPWALSNLRPKRSSSSVPATPGEELRTHWSSFSSNGSTDSTLQQTVGRGGEDGSGPVQRKGGAQSARRERLGERHKMSKSNAKSGSRKKDAPIMKSSWMYFFAAAPIPLMIVLSLVLRSIITSPPADYGKGSMFDLIATRYDFINRALALNLDMSWRRRLVEEVVGPSGELFRRGDKVRLLDLATGTADVAILLGKAAEKHNSGVVLGVDPSQNMLNVGIAKVEEESLSSVVSLELGDARKLDALDDNTFDAATMSFGIRNVPQKAQALCEINRVLKKKSRAQSKLAIMEFSEPGEDSGIMGAGARLFIRHVVPAMGAMLSGHPREYMHLQKSINEFPSPKEFVAMMEGLKCPVTGTDGVETEIDTYGSFRVEDTINLNFGSVQIFVATPILRRLVTE